MRAVFAALAANLGIALAKFIAFLFTHSASMLAESVHSVADTGNEVLLLVGRGRSLRPPSDEHPFGFGRERYFYGFVVSVMLFTVGAAFSVYDGLHKILNPEPIRSPLVALVVLALSAVLEGFSLRTGIAEANKVRGDRNWGTFIRRTKAPELPVVLLEDLAALIGLAFAFTGVTLSALTGNGRWDGAGSLAIGGLLATAAAILAVEMKSLLIGEAASAEVQRTDRRRAGGRARGGPGHPHADRAHKPGLDPGRGEDRGPRHRYRGPGRGRHRRRGAAGPRGRPDRQHDLPGAGHLPPVPGRPHRPVDPRRGVVSGGRSPPDPPCCFSRGDPSPRTPLGRDPSPQTPLGRGFQPPGGPRARPPGHDPAKDP